MFEIVINDKKITREHLLDKNPEELYMSHYLGINPQYGLFCSPLRADTNPTCSFYRDKKSRLIFKDFGDKFHGDFLDVVKKIYNCSYGKAIDIVANDFKIRTRSDLVVNPPKIVYDNTKIESTAPTIIQCEVKKWSTPDLKWWKQFGITRKTLDKFNVYPIKTVFLNGEVFCFSTKSNPIYGYYYGKKDGIEQWKIYFPNKVTHRFLLNTSTVQGLSKLSKEFKDVVVVTKSMKDVMTLWELGIPAIAPQAESVILDKKIADKILQTTKYLIVNGDYDKAGINFMQSSRRRFPCICLTFKDKEFFGKDISDFVAKHGMDKARELVNDLKKRLVNGEFDYQLNYAE